LPCTVTAAFTEACFVFCRASRVAGRFLNPVAGALAVSSALAPAGAAMGLESSFGGLEGLEEENRLWRGLGGSAREVLRLDACEPESELRTQGILLLRTALLIEETNIMVFEGGQT